MRQSIAFDYGVHRELVESVANQIFKKLPRGAVVLEDLIQNGWIGLLRALEKYDSSCGASFKTYAGSILIRGAILDALRKSHSRYIPKIIRELEGARESVERRSLRPARGIEIARELKITVESYHRKCSKVYEHVLASFEGIDTQGTIHQLASCLIDHNGDPAYIAEIEQERAYLQKKIALLDNDLIKNILREYFLEGKSLLQIAHDLEKSESRISQLVKEGVRLLRSAYGINDL